MRHPILRTDRPKATASSRSPGMRQTIARRMVESKTQAPHFYVTMDIDMAPAMALREPDSTRCCQKARSSR